VWPAGFVGSIAHDDALAVAAAARVDAARTVGIDVERHDALGVEDAYVVLREDELDFVGDDPSRATLLWGAKEAAYKAWCTGLEVELDQVDPRDIHVTVLDSTAFEVQAVGDLRERVAAIGGLRGGWTHLGELAITLVWKLPPFTA
jgi:4'-phosphopantetheinyl transferase EntD